MNQNLATQFFKKRRKKWQKYLIALIPLLAFFTLLSFISCEYEPYKQGKNLYKYYCANCHMEEGQGLRGLYPPLAQSDYLAQHQDQIACIIRNGLSGKIIVNGTEYDQPMAAIPNLNEVEITNIVNFINHAWGNELPVRKISEIKMQLESCLEE